MLISIKKTLNPKPDLDPLFCTWLIHFLEQASNDFCSCCCFCLSQLNHVSVSCLSVVRWSFHTIVWILDAWLASMEIDCSCFLGVGGCDMLNAADVQGAQLLCSWAARNYHYWYANWWHPQSFAASVPNNANKSQFIKISWPNLDDRWQCVKQDSLNWGHSYVHPSMTQIFQNVKGMVTWADKKHGASSAHLDALVFLIGLYTYQRNGTSRMRAPNGVKLYMWICFKQREGKIGAYDNPHFSSRPMKCDGSKHTTLQECVYCKVGAKPGQTP
jgi:hypothetical protein